MAIFNAPLSEPLIASMAASVLDEFSVNALNEDTALGRFMTLQYSPTRRELLEAYPWAMATKRAALPALANAPAFGWSYQYQMPVDCLRVLPLAEEGALDGAPIPYATEGRLILTDAAAPLKIRYIKDETDATQFTPTFARALASLLALYAATNITAKVSYKDIARRSFDDAMRVATTTDSLSRGTPESQNRSDILDVRGRGIQ